MIPEAIANYHHRISSKAGDYGNTVMTSDATHRAYENLYRTKPYDRPESDDLAWFVMAMSAHLS